MRTHTQNQNVRRFQVTYAQQIKPMQKAKGKYSSQLPSIRAEEYCALPSNDQWPPQGLKLFASAPASPVWGRSGMSV